MRLDFHKFRNSQYTVNYIVPEYANMPPQAVFHIKGGAVTHQTELCCFEAQITKGVWGRATPAFLCGL